MFVTLSKFVNIKNGSTWLKSIIKGTQIYFWFNQTKNLYFTQICETLSIKIVTNSVKICRQKILFESSSCHTIFDGNYFIKNGLLNHIPSKSVLRDYQLVKMTFQF